MGGLTTEAAGMTTVTTMAAMGKEEVIRSWRTRGRTGWSIFGCAANKEEGKAKEKAGQTGWGGVSAAQPLIMGPCGTTKLMKTMAVAVTRRMRIKRSSRSKGERRTRRRMMAPLRYTPRCSWTTGTDHRWVERRGGGADTNVRR